MSANGWKVGDRVVCTAPARKKRNGRVSGPHGVEGYARDPQYPKSGETYTIRNINPIEDGKVLLLFDEVRNDHLTAFIRGGLEPGFSSEFFAPAEAS